MKQELLVRAKVWKYAGAAAWYFVELSKTHSDRVRKWKVAKKVGFGYIPVTVVAKGVTWKTTLFPSKDNGPFLMALKAQVRKKAEIYEEDTIQVRITHP